VGEAVVAAFEIAVKSLPWDGDLYTIEIACQRVPAPETKAISVRPLPPAAEGEAMGAGARLRPALGVWLRDLVVSLAISAFIIVFIYQPVKWKAPA